MKPRRRKFPPHVYADLIRRQGGLCACGCGEPLEIGRIHYDHIVALAIGGKDEPSNLQALILRHHAAKTKADMVKIAKVKRIDKKDRLLKGRTAMDRAIAKHLEKKGATA